MPISTHHNFCACSIIGKKHHEGVLPASFLSFDVLDDSSNRNIHFVDHRGMDGHLGYLEFLLLWCQHRPGDRSVDFAATKFLDRGWE